MQCIVGMTSVIVTGMTSCTYALNLEFKVIITDSIFSCVLQSKSSSQKSQPYSVDSPTAVWYDLNLRSQYKPFHMQLMIYIYHRNITHFL